MANPNGRPPKFTADKRAEFVRLIQAGHSHRNAAARVGISVRQVHYWRKKLRDFDAACYAAWTGS